VVPGRFRRHRCLRAQHQRDQCGERQPQHQPCGMSTRFGRSAPRENLTLAGSLPHQTAYHTHERSYPVVAPPGRMRELGGGCAAVRSTRPRQVKAARGLG
jgi:hypothetical protein